MIKFRFLFALALIHINFLSLITRFPFNRVILKLKNLKFYGSCCCKFLQYFLLTHFENTFQLSKHFWVIKKEFQIITQRLFRSTRRGALAIKFSRLLALLKYFNCIRLNISLLKTFYVNACYFFSCPKTYLTINMRNIKKFFSFLAFKFNLIICCS